MDEVLEQFQTGFDKLRERSGRLSAALREVCRNLSESGRVPSSPLIEDLRRFRADFRELGALCQRDSGLDGEQHGSTTAVESLADLEQEFKCCMTVRSAVALLNRLDAIKLTDQRDAAIWQRCLSEGRAIRRELMACPTSLAVAHANQLLSDKHPLRAVVMLISDHDELSDERWRELHDAVVEVYGRDLATAIVRQRLTMPSVGAGTPSNN